MGTATPSRFRPGIPILLGALLVPGLAAQDGEVPPPPPGRAAHATLALLHYNRDVCDGIAGKVVGHWRGLDGSPEAQEEAVRDLVTDRDLLSQLAAGRAAGDIVRDLLPRTREEAGSETGATLERLSGLVKELCDTVALPTAPREGFEERVADLLDRIEREEGELGRLLVVPEAELEKALEPYLTPIQIAGFEAENEYLDYLESQKEKPQAPTLTELMHRWHREYSREVLPTKQALGKYLKARQANDSRGMAGACKEILEAVIPLLRDGEIFKIPTPLLPASRGVEMRTLPPLHKAYQEIRDMAIACRNGRTREVIVHLEEMQRQLRAAAGHLGEHGLAP
jgi:hypothetical protein